MMRKYVIGFLAGAVFATAATAFADDIQSLIGREVQGEFTITVKGKELEQKAIVIDGTSFAPVRSISEANGLDVQFDMEKGITLTKKEEPQVSPTPTATEKPMYPAKETYDHEIENLKLNIKVAKAGVEEHPDNEKLKENLRALEEYQAKLIAERDKFFPEPSPTPAQ